METISSALLLGQSGSSSFELQAKSLIKASEANVSRIDSQIRDLLRLRDQERGLIASLKLVIAPIRKLPAELLAEIFLIAVDNVSHDRNNLKLKLVLALCQVCAHWRQLVVTTPRLWALSLSIRITKPPSDAYLATTKTFLERSGPLPIPISLIHEGPEASPLVDFVYSLAPRWRSLAFYYSKISRLRNLPMTALKSLERLDFKTRQDILSHESTVNVFLGAPRLRTVVLDAQTNKFPMPWPQLTELILSEKSSQICLDVLVQCTNIVTASFSNMEPWIQSPGSAFITRLSHLQKLALEFVDSEGRFIMSFFRCLDLPALADLSIASDQTEASWLSTDFTAFQRRSPNIEHLSIENCSLSVADLICILRDGPNLVKLRLEACMDCIDNSIFELLQYSDLNTVHPAPRLRELRISYSADNFEERVLKKMIRSRWWTDAQLLALPAPPAVARWKVIYIDRGDAEYENFSETFKSTMDRLRAEGLEVDIG